MTPRKPASRKKADEHLVAHQRAEHRAGLVGEHAPVGAELVAHDDAGHDAHAEADGEDLLPVVEEIEEDGAAGPEPQRLQHGEIAGEPDGEGREDDVEGDGEGELDAGQSRASKHFHVRSLPCAAVIFLANSANPRNAASVFKKSSISYDYVRPSPS